MESPFFRNLGGGEQLVCFFFTCDFHFVFYRFVRVLAFVVLYKITLHVAAGDYRVLKEYLQYSFGYWILYCRYSLYNTPSTYAHPLQKVMDTVSMCVLEILIYDDMLFN